MDPISALNVAAATLQFLDFTGKVAAGTYQVYKRGSAHTTRHGDIKTLTTSLTELNDELQVSLATQEMVQKPTRLDKDLAELGKKCNEVGQRLINALERLQIQDKQTIWSSFGIALRSIWNDGDIDSLFKDLADYRAQMAMHILVAMR